MLTRRKLMGLLAGLPWIGAVARGSGAAKSDGLGFDPEKCVEPWRSTTFSGFVLSDHYRPSKLLDDSAPRGSFLEELVARGRRP